MLSERLKNSIKDYPDFPKKGINFKDVLEITQNPEIFRELIVKMSFYLTEPKNNDINHWNQPSTESSRAHIG